MNSSENSILRPFTCRPYGPQAWLVYLNQGADVKMDDLIREIGNTPPSDFVEYVVGYDSLMLIFNTDVEIERVYKWLARVRSKAEIPGKDESRLVRIPVTYGGDDLVDFAKAKGMSVEEVVRRHTEPEYCVRMLGFAPGFPYLDGLDPALYFPRKDRPVSRIEVGSVAIGGEHAGIYSIASPGGWHVLGRTRLKLFDPGKANGTLVSSSNSFALRPRDRVKFVEV